MMSVVERTVNRNCHDFSQDKVIGANECGDAPERIELEVLGIINWRFGLHKFDVEVVGFGNHQENCGAGIALYPGQL
jgi:hypothetical protein